jgi:hypothetical protein
MNGIGVSDVPLRTDQVCPHCHQPALVRSQHPRFRGYCHRCAQMLSHLPGVRSLDSA